MLQPNYVQLPSDYNVQSTYVHSCQFWCVRNLLGTTFVSCPFFSFHFHNPQGPRGCLKSFLSMMIVSHRSVAFHKCVCIDFLRYLPSYHWYSQWTRYYTQYSCLTDWASAIFQVVMTHCALSISTNILVHTSFSSPNYVISVPCILLHIYIK